MEDILRLFSLGDIEHFVGKDIHIDHTENAAFFIHDGKGEKLVKDEKLARIQKCGFHRDRDHARDHAVGD